MCQIKGAGGVFHHVVVVTAHGGKFLVTAIGRPNDSQQLVGVCVGGGGTWSVAVCVAVSGVIVIVGIVIVTAIVVVTVVVHLVAGRVVLVVNYRGVAIAGDFSIVARHTARDDADEHQGYQQKCQKLFHVYLSLSHHSVNCGWSALAYSCPFSWISYLHICEMSFLLAR